MKKSLFCLLLLVGIVCVGCQNKDNSDKVVVEEKEAVVEEFDGANAGEEKNFNDENVSEEDDIFGEEDFNTFFEKGKELLDKGDVKGAIEQFNKSLKINDKADWVIADLGRAKKENNDLDGAVECFTKAIEINNNRPVYYEWRADVYNLLDKKDLSEKDMQQAKDLRDKGLE